MRRILKPEPKIYTLNPKPKLLPMKSFSQTQNLKPWTHISKLHVSTLNPTPYTLNPEP